MDRIKSKNDKIKSVLFSVLKEFAEKTSMDGLQYIADEEASIWERYIKIKRLN